MKKLVSKKSTPVKKYELGGGADKKTKPTPRMSISRMESKSLPSIPSRPSPRPMPSQDFFPKPNFVPLAPSKKRKGSVSTPKQKTSGIPYKTGPSSPVENTMRKGGKATMKKTRKCC